MKQKIKARPIVDADPYMTRVRSHCDDDRSSFYLLLHVPAFLHRGTRAILQDFHHDVKQISWDVREPDSPSPHTCLRTDITRTLYQDMNILSGAEVLLHQKTCFFGGLFADVYRITCVI